MERGTIHIYSGDGHGKSPAALGRAVAMACQGKNVVIIQFLKGKGLEDSEFLRRLEPEIKLFRFEKSDGNYAEQVLCTGGCDLLIMDEVLRLIDNRIITVEELKMLLDMRADDSMDIIMTGITLNDEVCKLADEVTRLENIKC